MRLAKSLTNLDMQITFTFLNTLWKSEKGRMRKEHMNIKKEGKQIRHIGQRFGRKHVIALSFFMPLIVRLAAVLPLVYSHLVIIRC